MVSSSRSLFLEIVRISPQHRYSYLRANLDLQVAPQMPLYTGFVQLGAGLSVGLAGLAAGFAIGIVGDAGVRGTAQQPRLFVGMVSHSMANC